MIVFSVFYNTHRSKATLDIVLMVIVIIAMVLWSYVWISASLAAVDGKDDIVNFRSLSVHMPTLRQFFMLVVTGVVVGVICAVGFVLLIIPGIYFAMRLIFATTSYVDRQGSLKQSLEYSWHLVKGPIFWTVFLVFIIEVLLAIIGSVTFMIGSLVTYPLAILLMVKLYRTLTIHQRSIDTAAQQ